MRHSAWMVFAVSTLVISLLNAAAAESSDAIATANLARFILKATEIKPGSALCAHVGCSEGRLIAELAKSGKFLAHGVSSNAADVANARKLLQTEGIYGQASVMRGDLKKLPYSDNIVNLLVVDNLSAVLKAGLSPKEIMRVVAPLGMIFIGQREGAGDAAFSEKDLKAALTAAGITKFEIVKEQGIWARAQKPRSQEMDEWTHQRHGADGNMVSRDNVGPPTGLRWITGPGWARGPHTYTVNAVVVTSEHIFCLTPNDSSNSAVTPENMRWYLVARDAYNGLLKWKRPWEGLLPFSPGAPRDSSTAAEHASNYSVNFPEPANVWQKPSVSTWNYRSLPLTAVGKYVYAGGTDEVLILDAQSGDVVCRSEKMGSFPDTVLVEKDHLLVATANEALDIDPISGKTK